jgi:hypothetical protein
MPFVLPNHSMPIKSKAITGASNTYVVSSNIKNVNMAVLDSKYVIFWLACVVKTSAIPQRKLFITVINDLVNVDMCLDLRNYFAHN